MINPRYFISDFVEIQRKSFFELLEKGIIDEFSKRNPITSLKKDIELYFYPEYYKLTIPEYSPRQAIIKSKSYTSKLYIPVQLTYKKSKLIRLKWAYIGNLPIMTKRGHFILNGAARVIVNQIIRSPGIYYQEKLHETFSQKWSQKAETSYKRYYADLICLRGTWLRLEIDKDKNIWAQTKKGPKIPIFWFLIAMGLSERVIFNSILEPNRLVQNLACGSDCQSQTSDIEKQIEYGSTLRTKAPRGHGSLSPESAQKNTYAYVKNPPSAWKEIFLLLQKKNYINNPNIAFSSTPIESSIGTAGTGFRKIDGRKGSISTSNSQPKSTASQMPLRYNKLDSSQSLGLDSQSAHKTRSTTKSIPISTITNISLETSSNVNSFSTKEFKKRDKKVILAGLPVSPSLNNQLGWTASQSATSNAKLLGEQGRKWLFSKFMNPRSYDLGKQGRSAFNRKLGLKIDERQLILTAQDLLYATDYLIKVEKGLKNLDDIDHLKNRRVRTSGELIQIQIGIAIVRLEKIIRDKINKTSIQFFVLSAKEKFKTSADLQSSLQGGFPRRPKNPQDEIIGMHTLKENIDSQSNSTKPDSQSLRLGPAVGSRVGSSVSPKNLAIPSLGGASPKKAETAVPFQKIDNPRSKTSQKIKTLTISSLINNKAFNSAIREFFGTSPLSQFMDQINPLAEITHKRRLSSMGPGGVTRDTATLAIRGIHPTHYGRICPIETPEGKNTGLVNSMTAYARVNPLGMLESPFYKVYKGIVLKTSGMFFLSADHEEKIKLAAADLLVTPVGFLPDTNIPVRIGENFTKIHRNKVEYIGVSPIQMISIATSLIPFLEHDDANRALMGSNMQRQAVPLIRPERPIVGTGLEPRAVSDSGHVIQAKFSGVVTYVSAEKIIVTTLRK